MSSKLAQGATLALILGLTCPITAPNAVAAAASVQEERVRPSLVVVRADDTRLNSRPSSIFYPVATLKAGTILEVVDERNAWLGVAYPEGARAVVSVASAQVRTNGDGKRVAVLTTDDPLRALNIVSPVMADCYAQVFPEKPVQRGTSLEIVADINKRDGTLGGYIVVPPAGARGYVLPTQVRVATAEETEAYWAEMGDPIEPPPVPVADPIEVQQEPEVTTPEQASGEQSPANTAGSDPAPTSTNEGAGDEASTDQATTQAETPSEPDPFDEVEERLTALDLRLERILKTPLGEAEVNPLIDAYNALAVTLPDLENKLSVIAAIDSRIELLRIRSELQQILREASAIEERVGEAPGNDAVRRSLSLGYQTVGRLMPSLIYDGDGLPLLYRVVSVDGITGRTLAYIVPSEELDFEDRLGTIVGVRGVVTTQQDRRIPVIRPETIDALNRE